VLVESKSTLGKYFKVPYWYEDEYVEPPYEALAYPDPVYHNAKIEEETVPCPIFNKI
jgi:hypothetical protein